MSTNMRKIFFAIICVYTLTIVSCIDRLYFNSAPDKNIELVKKEFSKWPDLTGVYKLNINYLDSTADNFKLNKFDNYEAPVILKTFNDTLEYMGSLMIGDRYVEITESHGIYRFLSFECVNKNIFTQFFSYTRTIDKKSTVSASFESDTIVVKIHNNEKKKGSSNDTTYKYRGWIRGELICFSKGGESYFPKSIDLNDNNSSNLNYFTVIQNQFYFVHKDTTEGNNRYEISNLLLDTNSFMIRALNKEERTDTILNELGVQHEGDLIHFNESQLISIFKSPLAINEVIATRIHGFPLLSEDSGIKSIFVKYWYAAGIGFLLLIILVKLLFRKKASTG